MIRLLILGKKKVVVVEFINIYTYYLYIRINMKEKVNRKAKKRNVKVQIVEKLFKKIRKKFRKINKESINMN